jgi:hypothetical protein
MPRDGNPLQRGAGGLIWGCKAPAPRLGLAGKAIGYLSGSLTRLEFDPPSESFAFTLRTSVPAAADVFGVSLAVHVVELAFVIVTVR